MRGDSPYTNPVSTSVFVDFPLCELSGLTEGRGLDESSGDAFQGLACAQIPKP